MERSLRGLDVLLACRRSTRLGDAEPEPQVTVVVDDDGFDGAVSEVVGFDVSTVSPYLSAFASGFGGSGGSGMGFGGGGGDKSTEMAKKQAELEMQKREAERKAASSRTTLWVVLGLLGTALLGTGVYFAARK